VNKTAFFILNYNPLIHFICLDVSDLCLAFVGTPVCLLASNNVQLSFAVFFYIEKVCSSVDLKASAIMTSLFNGYLDIIVLSYTNLEPIVGVDSYEQHIRPLMQIGSTMSSKGIGQILID